MDKSFETEYHESEDSNWWHTARRSALVKEILKFPHSSKILDIGCAGGSLIKSLMDLGYTNITGIDYSHEAIIVCNRKGINNVFEMDGTSPQFPQESFDIIISSDSLEHMEKDQVALSNWNKLLKNGGTLILFVPAHKILWSGLDDTNHHFRRYQKKDLVEKLISAGFVINRAGYWNFALFFPILLIRIIQNMNKNKKDKSKKIHLKSSELVNRFLKTLLIIENYFFHYYPYPIGISLYVKAKKDA